MRFNCLVRIFQKASNEGPGSAINIVFGHPKPWWFWLAVLLLVDLPIGVLIFILGGMIR